MKHLVVMAAALGWDGARKNGLGKAGDVALRPAKGVFPAVTCTAQGTLRTALAPKDHGMVANGYYSRILRRPLFWEQSSALVEGKRIWEGTGLKTGMYFFQQSMGEKVDYVLSPAPVHKHGGGMIMRNYTVPEAWGESLAKMCGTFPLHRYWGPLASARVGRECIANFKAMLSFEEAAGAAADVHFLYLPTLDYDLQRWPQTDVRCGAAWKELKKQLKELQAIAHKAGADFTVLGDYAIEDVTAAPAFPNKLLREAGLFNVRHVGSRAYPDFHTSKAFAMCDHQIAHVYLRDAGDAERIAALFEATGAYGAVEVKDAQEWAHANAGEMLLTAKQGSWCAYPWWNDPSEAPDWATHIDIHNKPGYDPCELFFGRLFPPATCQDATKIRGTHGRECTIAWGSTKKGLDGGSLADLAGGLLA
ncbi:MAG: alkaline phosphatase family protein [Kiritimatiellae bacterium]|nr:alkaline phosphatase family protein [Kiritimatiellia bacterium]